MLRCTTCQQTVSTLTYNQHWIVCPHCDARWVRVVEDGETFTVEGFQAFNRRKISVARAIQPYLTHYGRNKQNTAYLLVAWMWDGLAEYIADEAPTKALNE